MIVRCRCGKSLQCAESMAGRRVRCPACQELVAVPAAAVPPQPLSKAAAKATAAADWADWASAEAVIRLARQRARNEPAACPTCSGRIDRKAPWCPHCGRTFIGRIWLLMIAIALLPAAISLLFWLLFFAGGRGQPVAPLDPGGPFF